MSRSTPTRMHPSFIPLLLAPLLQHPVAPNALDAPAAQQRAASHAFPDLNSSLWPWDYSFAGYRRGEEALPEARGPVLDVTDFGAIPDDGRDDAVAIQRALTAAESNAPCVVYFPPGRFQLGSTKAPPSAPLTMTASHVVLRGSGHGAGGTELFLAHHLQALNPEQMWTTPYALQLGPRSIEQGVPARVIRAGFEAPVQKPLQWFALELDHVDGLMPGDWLRIAGRHPAINAAWIAPRKVESEWTRMIEKGVQVSQRLQIKRIDGKVVWLHAPLRLPLLMTALEQLELVATKQTLGSEIGVEDLAFVGAWQAPFKHHKDDVHDGGWSLLRLQNVVDSWIARCRFTDVNRPWVVASSANVSVLDSFTDGNKGHHATGLSEATNCLVAWYDDRAGHHHGPGVQARSAGNVFHRVTWTATNSFEAHANYPMLTLFDECRGALRYGHWGGDRRALPNHLGGLAFWNFEQIGAPVRDFEFWRARKHGVHGRVMPPVIVGWFGAAEPESSLAEGQARALQSKGEAVKPASLWKQQLAGRLGFELPAWLTER